MVVMGGAFYVKILKLGATACVYITFVRNVFTRITSINDYLYSMYIEIIYSALLLSSYRKHVKLNLR